MEFRKKLLRTLAAFQPVLEEPGILIAVSEVPNLMETEYRRLRPDQQYDVRSALTILSLMEPRMNMPDPVPHRALFASILHRLEEQEPEK